MFYIEWEYEVKSEYKEVVLHSDHGTHNDELVVQGQEPHNEYYQQATDFISPDYLLVVLDHQPHSNDNAPVWFS